MPLVVLHCFGRDATGAQIIVPKACSIADLDPPDAVRERFDVLRVAPQPPASRTEERVKQVWLACAVEQTIVRCMGLAGVAVDLSGMAE